jgi:hypothetical protein
MFDNTKHAITAKAKLLAYKTPVFTGFWAGSLL